MLVNNAPSDAGQATSVMPNFPMRMAFADGSKVHLPPTELQPSYPTNSPSARNRNHGSPRTEVLGLAPQTPSSWSLVTPLWVFVGVSLAADAPSESPDPALHAPRATTSAATNVSERV